MKNNLYENCINCYVNNMWIYLYYICMINFLFDFCMIFVWFFNEKELCGLFFFVIVYIYVYMYVKYKEWYVGERGGVISNDEYILILVKNFCMLIIVYNVKLWIIIMVFWYSVCCFYLFRKRRIILLKLI